jgi:hypothetical protein
MVIFFFKILRRRISERSFQLNVVDPGGADFRNSIDVESPGFFEIAFFGAFLNFSF